METAGADKLTMELDKHSGLTSSVCSNATAETPGDSGLHSDMTHSLTDDDALCPLDGPDIPELIHESTNKPQSNLPDVVLKAFESEQTSLKCDSNGNIETESVQNIVHRRKCKNKQQTGSRKKRVSFHEDILNSTRIDDIHIDHGFISYRGECSNMERFAPVIRNSWSATENHINQNKPHFVMSDLLMYGATDASTLYSPDDNCETVTSPQNSDSDLSSDMSNEPPFKSFSCDFEDSAQGGMRKQFFSESDVEFPRKRLKSVLKKTNYLPTQVVDESSSKKSGGRLQVLKSLKSFYETFKYGLTSTTSGLSEEEIHQQTKNQIDEVVEVSPDIGFTSSTPERCKLTLNTHSPLKDNHKEKQVVDSKNLVYNCESTVYEHKGLSFCYENDAFKTPFVTSNESFKPISDVSNEVQVKIDEVCENNLENSQSKSEISELSTNISKDDSLSRVSSKEVGVLVRRRLDETKHLMSPKKQNLKTTTKSMDEDYENDQLTVECSQSTLLSKASILNRYLKNVQQKQAFDAQLKKNKFFKRKSSNFLIPIVYNKKLIDQSFVESARKLNRLIDREIMENRRISVKLLTSDGPSYFDSFEDDFAIECNERLRMQVFSQPDEVLHRMVRCRSRSERGGVWYPIVVLVSQKATYSLTIKDYCYNIIQTILHKHLTTIEMGPDYQYVRLIDEFGGTLCAVTGDSRLSERLACAVAWASYTPNKQAQVVSMSLSSNTRFYGEIYVDDGVERVYKECEPTMEGHLMYKTSNDSQWRPSHFVLSDGVLKWDQGELRLKNVEGVRRAVGCQRPHCFELITNSRKTIHRLVAAASGEQNACLWLQALLRHAARSVAPVPPRPQQCSALAARLHITGHYFHLTHDECMDIICRTHVSMLTCVTLPTDGGDRCQLEWSVCEGSSDVILLFASSHELERFLAALEVAYKLSTDGSQAFPLCVGTVRSNVAEALQMELAKVLPDP